MTALRSLRLLLVAFYSIPILLIEAKGCYTPDGSASDDSKWPCNPDADTSLCCDAADYCLDSLLCLNTGADNLLSLQGCTNPTWPVACNPICPGASTSILQFEILVIPPFEHA